MSDLKAEDVAELLIAVGNHFGSERLPLIEDT